MTQQPTAAPWPLPGQPHPQAAPPPPPPPPPYPPPAYPPPYPPPPYGYFAPQPYPTAYYEPSPWRQPAQPWAPPPYYGYPVPAPVNPLDEAVAAGRHLPGRWFLAGLAQVPIPLGAIVAMVVVVLALGLPRDQSSGELYSLLASIASGGVVWLSGRAIARQHGGWLAAFGFSPPRWRDIPCVLGWSGIQIGARIALMIVLTVIAPGLSDSHGGNVEGTSELHGLGIVMMFVGAVLIAPVMEELAFRGIVLRGLMRRMSFWPAALISSTLFALLHIPGAAHVAAIPSLLAAIMLFAVLQCVLVRRTGRLGPAMCVHGLMNLIVTVLALTTGS